MRIFLYVIWCFFLFLSPTEATMKYIVQQEGQATIYGLSSDTKPTTAPDGFVFIEEDTGKVFRRESSVWVEKLNNSYATAGGAGVPQSAILMMISGACPTGYTEVSALNGKTLLGTLDANANVGTTGGSDTITPAGTNSTPTFSGSALGTHSHGAGTYATSAHSGTAVTDHTSHTHTYTDVVNHTHIYASQTATTGGASSYEHGPIDTSSAAAEASIATNTPAGGVATGTTAGPSATLTHSVTQPSNHTLSGSSESVSAGTPAGTVSTPTFTGTGFDNRSAFARVIFCSKD